MRELDSHAFGPAELLRLCGWGGRFIQFVVRAERGDLSEIATARLRACLTRRQAMTGKESWEATIDAVLDAIPESTGPDAPADEAIAVV